MPRPEVPGFLQRENRAAVFGRSHDLYYDGIHWGFVIFRTTTSPVTDETFTRALAKLKAYLRFSLAGERVNGEWRITAESEELVMAKLRLPVVVLAETADDEAVRAAMQDWCDANTDDQFRVVEQCCLVLDNEAVASLTAAPEPGPGLSAEAGCAAWARVVALEIDDPEDTSFVGWFRVRADALDDLYHVQCVGDPTTMRIAPRVEREGQIPIYDSSPGGYILDEEGNYRTARV